MASAAVTVSASEEQEYAEIHSQGAGRFEDSFSSRWLRMNLL